MTSFRFRLFALAVLLVAAAVGCGESWEGSHITEGQQCATKGMQPSEKSKCAPHMFCESDAKSVVTKGGQQYELGTCQEQHKAGESCEVEAACAPPLHCLQDPKVAALPPSGDEIRDEARKLIKTCQ